MNTTPAPAPAPQPAPPAPARQPYERPALERLGHWSALTLQQSIPLTP